MKISYVELELLMKIEFRSNLEEIWHINMPGMNPKMF